MSIEAAAAVWRQALRIVLSEMAAIVVIAAVFALVWNGRAASSVLAGGCIGVVATGYLLIAMLKRRLRPGSGGGVGGMFFSWLVKSLLTIGLLMVALKSQVFLPPALLAGLFASLAGYWLSLVSSRVEHAGRIDGK